MCGRYTLISRPTSIVAQFEVDDVPEMPPRYNIAPTQPVAAIRVGQAGREFAMLRWGLIPFWAADKKIGVRLLNARAETVATTPAFRDAFRGRRCLIPADGYYEWQTLGRRKQPYYHRLRDGSLFAFAGLWDSWRQGEEKIESCSIITTEANGMLPAIHDRMPVILDRHRCALWLDRDIEDPEALKALLRPYPADAMTCSAVNPIVNNYRHDGPECIEAVSGAA
jgi:putative SOS response-associated peptidase YedK